VLLGVLLLVVFAPLPDRTATPTVMCIQIDNQGVQLAAPMTSPPSTITLWTGRALLWWARLLQATVAGKARRKAHVARRNAAMRAAHARGVDRDTITQAIGLSGEQVRKAIRGEATTE
jgi:hypothetical protein